MDTPRRWQAASLATAVASLSIGGLMIARPTSDAVAAIDLDRGGELRDLGIASPGEPAASWSDTEANQIITPAEPVAPTVGPSSDSATTPEEDPGAPTSQPTDDAPAAPLPPADASNDSPNDPPAGSASSVDSND